jgi:hypothetical protein
MIRNGREKAASMWACQEQLHAVPAVMRLKCDADLVPQIAIKIADS